MVPGGSIMVIYQRCYSVVKSCIINNVVTKLFCNIVCMLQHNVALYAVARLVCNFHKVAKSQHCTM